MVTTEKLIDCVHISEGMYARLATEALKEIERADEEASRVYIDIGGDDVYDDEGNYHRVTGCLQLYTEYRDCIGASGIYIESVQAVWVACETYNADNERIVSDFVTADFINYINAFIS